MPDLTGVEHSSVGMMGAFRAEGPGHGFLSQMLKKGSGTSFSLGLYEVQGNSSSGRRSSTPPGHGHEARPAAPAAVESQPKPSLRSKYAWQGNGGRGSTSPRNLTPTVDFAMQNGWIFYHGWWYTTWQMHELLARALANVDQGKGKGKGKRKG